MTRRLILKTERDTIDLAELIEPILDEGSVLMLSGDLGSGKTFFVKALGKAMGVQEEIDSPSFVLLKEYHSGKIPLYHLDLYRLKSEEELMDLGLFDVIESGVTVIEWPRLAQKVLPYQTLSLKFGFEGEGRYVDITGEDKFTHALAEFVSR